MVFWATFLSLVAIRLKHRQIMFMRLLPRVMPYGMHPIPDNLKDHHFEMPKVESFAEFM